VLHDEISLDALSLRWGGETKQRRQANAGETKQPRWVGPLFRQANMRMMHVQPTKLEGVVKKSFQRHLMNIVLARVNTSIL
jgi:SLT domain-containing protein